MSRREGRDSDTRQHRSGPKRSRRGGKPQTERVVSNADVGGRHDHDEKQRRRLQDALPLEAAPTVSDPSKVESVAVNNASDVENKGHHERTKHSSDPTDATAPDHIFSTINMVVPHKLVEVMVGEQLLQVESVDGEIPRIIMKGKLKHTKRGKERRNQKPKGMRKIIGAMTDSLKWRLIHPHSHHLPGNDLHLARRRFFDFFFIWNYRI